MGKGEGTGPGRPKGSSNRATAPIREMIAKKDPIGQLFALAKETDNADLKLRALTAVLPYGFPRLASTQVDLQAALGGHLTVEFGQEEE